MPASMKREDVAVWMYADALGVEARKVWLPRADAVIALVREKVRETISLVGRDPALWPDEDSVVASVLAGGEGEV